MKTALILLSLLTWLSASAEQRPAMRYPVNTRESGWVRLQLTPELQRQADHLWLSDEQGTPVPFLKEPTGPTPSQARPVEAAITGRDEAGQATIEFAPPATTAPTNHPISLWLDMAPGRDWAARLQISRRLGDGAWLRFESTRTEAIYSFNHNDERFEALIPGDGTRYRVSLIPIAGDVPLITGATIRTESVATQPTHREPTEVHPESGSDGLWRLSAAAAFRVQAITLEVASAFAPVTCEAWIPIPDPNQNAPRRDYLPLSQATVWHLPALATSQLTVRPRDYPLIKEVVVRLPPGTRLVAAHFVAIEERWLFPAEANRTYYLQVSSTPQIAPGNLALLAPPTPERVLPVATIGAPQPDPAATPAQAATLTWESVAKILPWFVTVAVGLVGWAALRLLRKPKK